jgi:hypothetical protein
VGLSACRAAISSGLLANCCPTRGVSIRPGRIEFARIPREAYSRAIDVVSWFKAALAAL